MLRHSSLLLLSLGAPLIPLCAHAEVFLTEQQAIRTIFPAGTFTKKPLTLTDADVEKIEKESNTVRNKELNVWKSELGDCVFFDQVLGKHEMITIAVGVATDGSIKGVEILDYRETYGGQVRTEAWRKQFVGKRATSPIKLTDDIKNLSGATLSSSHVTAGVKRLVVTYEDIKARI